MLTPGDLIDGRYVIGDLLGRGGMAEVHRATDVGDGRAYALKVMCTTESGADDRFRWEAEALARVDHPGLVRLHCTGVHGAVRYLVLDLAEGPPLSQVLARGPAGVEQALSVGRQVAEALAHVHRRGMVHRDVKPSNILLHRDRALLADFGIARLPGAPALTVTGQVIGSAPYLAPEQVEGAPAGPPADVYALGLVLIECLTGRRCYPGTHAESALARLHRAPEIPAVPPWLRDVLVAMTAREPGRRPPAAAVAEALARRDAAPVVPVTAPLDLGADRPSRPALDGHRVPPRGGGHRVRTQAPVHRGRGGAGRRAGVRALAAAAVVMAMLGWTFLGGSPRWEPAATTDAGTPPTTVPALVAAPAPPTGEAASAAGPRDGGHRHRAVPGAATPAPRAAAAARTAASPAAAVQPPEPEPGSPAAEESEVPPTTATSAPPTTTTTTPPPSGNGNGNANGNGSGGTGTGGDGVDVPTEAGVPTGGGG